VATSTAASASTPASTTFSQTSEITSYDASSSSGSPVEPHHLLDRSPVTLLKIRIRKVLMVSPQRRSLECQ
jgi:hypothetical protein